MKCLWRLLYAFRSPVSRSFGQQSTVRPSQVKMAPYQERASSAAVIWYTVLFRQNRTDRPFTIQDGRQLVFWVVTRSTSPVILTGVREQEGTEQATSHHTSRPPDARMKRTCGS